MKPKNCLIFGGTGQVGSFLARKLTKNGYLITYSSSAAVRKTLRNFGLEIYNIKPLMSSSNFWSNGTVAIKNTLIDKNKNLIFFEKLSPMEEEHLLTKAAIPYKDPKNNSTSKDILENRLKEQNMSQLINTKSWRKKWGMTKTTFKS